MDSEWRAEELRQLNLTQLKLHLQALAQPAEIQLTLVPKPFNTAYEIADNFDNWRGGYVDNTPDAPGPILRLLEEIDSLLNKMGGRDGPWTDKALRSYEPWARIRLLASEALSEFAWPNEPPTAHI